MWFFTVKLWQQPPPANWKWKLRGRKCKQMCFAKRVTGCLVSSHDVALSNSCFWIKPPPPFSRRTLCSRNFTEKTFLNADFFFNSRRVSMREAKKQKGWRNKAAEKIKTIFITRPWLLPLSSIVLSLLCFSSSSHNSPNGNEMRRKRKQCKKACLASSYRLDLLDDNGSVSLFSQKAFFSAIQRILSLTWPFHQTPWFIFFRWQFLNFFDFVWISSLFCLHNIIFRWRLMTLNVVIVLSSLFPNKREFWKSFGLVLFTLFLRKKGGKFKCDLFGWRRRKPKPNFGYETLHVMVNIGFMELHARFYCWPSKREKHKPTSYLTPELWKLGQNPSQKGKTIE